MYILTGNRDQNYVVHHVILPVPWSCKRLKVLSVTISAEFEYYS